MAAAQAGCHGRCAASCRGQGTLQAGLAEHGLTDRGRVDARWGEMGLRGLLVMANFFAYVRRQDFWCHKHGGHDVIHDALLHQNNDKFAIAQVWISSFDFRLWYNREVIKMA